MPKFESEHYLPVESYAEALEVFHAISISLLFEFARHEQGNRDIIIRNFIARADMMVRAVFRLWDIQHKTLILFLNLHNLTKLIHVFLIGQNPGAGVIKIQVGLPGLSVPVLFHFQDCFNRLGWLISIGEI